MKVNYFETGLPPIGFLAQDCLSGVAALVKELLTREHVHEGKMSYWQLILLQSKANAVPIKARIFPKSIGSGPRTPGFNNG